MEHSPEVVDFIDNLQRTRIGPTVFNPWAHFDKDNDASKRSPEIRTENLARYLTQRRGRATTLLVAEAPGYQGAHFSGMAMTSERHLLGRLTHKNIFPADAFACANWERTSKAAVRKDGFIEPTATVVWGMLKDSGVDPRSVVLWNAFAYHPMRDGYLTNRKPTAEELKKGQPLLEEFLALFPGVKIIPVGRVSEGILQDLGIKHAQAYVRHPANGGVTEFRANMRRHWA